MVNKLANKTGVNKNEYSFPPPDIGSIEFVCLRRVYKEIQGVIEPNRTHFKEE